MTFKDGGAYDFHTNFERIKERLQQVIENEQDGRARNALGGVNYTSVHLEELPVYEGPGSGMPIQREEIEHSPLSPSRDTGLSRGDGLGPPNEPPPGYEEVEQQSVANDLEDRIRRHQ